MTGLRVSCRALTTSLLVLLSLAALGAEQWWERHGDRFLHVTGWSVPAPANWKATRDEDTLSFEMRKKVLRLSVNVEDSQEIVEAALAPIFADMKASNGGKFPPAERFAGMDGLVFVRRVIATKSRRIAVVHTLRPGSPEVHLVIMYGFQADQAATLQPTVDAFLADIRFTEAPKPSPPASDAGPKASATAICPVARENPALTGAAWPGNPSPDHSRSHRSSTKQASARRGS